MSEVNRLWELEVELKRSINFFEERIERMDVNDHEFDHYQLSLTVLLKERSSVRERRLVGLSSEKVLKFK